MAYLIIKKQIVSSFLKILAVGLVVGFGIKIFVLESFTVPTDSMEPTILRGSKIWLNKLPFTPRRGDIVAFQKDGESFVKRIVGLPSDSVVAEGGKFRLSKSENLNGGAFFKIPKRGETLTLNALNIDFYKTIIERGDGGAVTKLFDKIFINGSESTTYTFQQNYYFLQGDNTEGSIDSRDWGLIAENQIIGKPIFTQKH